MGPLSYMLSVDNRNVVMRRIPVPDPIWLAASTRYVTFLAQVQKGFSLTLYIRAESEPTREMRNCFSETSLSVYQSTCYYSLEEQTGFTLIQE
jgi:hypothetical protein